MPLPQREERYTYADYLTWDDGKRWELIGGVAYSMASASAPSHQRVSRELSWQLNTYLKGKPCELFYAPFDVRLNADDEDDTVVQPDLTVICDRSKIDDKGYKGAPDFIIEIISPSSTRHDRWVKNNLYKSVGVREYWIIDPDAKTLDVNLLTNGEYVKRAYGDTDTVEVSVLPGCVVDLKDVFAL
ncbi:MAG: Uma2 family endonuclease [Chitinispirillales bacterium]|jgi:Uma2 family endonuclease|nr:Uma2 family endonuclease [Chitinispirillales bacterium]